MNRWIAIALTSMMALTTLLTLAPTEAEACGNSMHRFKKRRPVMVVREAWHAINAGAHHEAIVRLATEFRDLNALATQFPDIPGIERRALHAMATAVVRTRGKWTRTPPPHRKGTTAILVGAAAVTNLNWATDLLARLAKIDVGARSHHAEALALTPGGRSQARVMLESLATTDQIPDATGWELLSDLRAENGESGASKIASIKALEMEGSLSPRAKRQPISFE